MGGTLSGIGSLLGPLGVYCLGAKGALLGVAGSILGGILGGALGGALGDRHGEKEITWEQLNKLSEEVRGLGENILAGLESELDNVRGLGENLTTMVESKFQEAYEDISG